MHAQGGYFETQTQGGYFEEEKNMHKVDILKHENRVDILKKVCTVTQGFNICLSYLKCTVSTQTQGKLLF